MLKNDIQNQNFDIFGGSVDILDKKYEKNQDEILISDKSFT